jgi:hypothetical protein
MILGPDYSLVEDNIALNIWLIILPDNIDIITLLDGNMVLKTWCCHLSE